MRPIPLPARDPARPRAAATETDGPRRLSCADLRCGCGSLLARRVAAGVELKCRRCKRTLVVPLVGG